jgi:hypothetical protein
MNLVAFAQDDEVIMSECCNDSIHDRCIETMQRMIGRKNWDGMGFRNSLKMDCFCCSAQSGIQIDRLTEAHSRTSSPCMYDGSDGRSEYRG